MCVCVYYNNNNDSIIFIIINIYGSPKYYISSYHLVSKCSEVFKELMLLMDSRKYREDYRLAIVSPRFNTHLAYPLCILFSTSHRVESRLWKKNNEKEKQGSVS